MNVTGDYRGAASSVADETRHQTMETSYQRQPRHQPPEPTGCTFATPGPSRRPPPTNSPEDSPTDGTGKEEAIDTKKNWEAYSVDAPAPPHRWHEDTLLMKHDGHLQQLHPMSPARTGRGGRPRQTPRPARGPARAPRQYRHRRRRDFQPATATTPSPKRMETQRRKQNLPIHKLNS